MFLKYSILISIFIFFYCEKSIKEKPFKERFLTEKNLEQIDSSKALNEKEKELLAAYVIRTGIAQIINEGDTAVKLDSTITINEAIEKQRMWLIEDSIRVAEEKRKAQEEYLIKEKKLGELRNVVLVAILEKEYREVDYKDYMICTVAIKNNSKKTIKGLKGVLDFKDMFGDEIIRLEIKYEENIPPAKRINETIVYDYNEFMDEWVGFRSRSLDKMTAVWEPEIIIFRD